MAGNDEQAVHSACKRQTMEWRAYPTFSPTLSPLGAPDRAPLFCSYSSCLSCCPASLCSAREKVSVRGSQWRQMGCAVYAGKSVNGMSQKWVRTSLASGSGTLVACHPLNPRTKTPISNISPAWRTECNQRLQDGAGGEQNCRVPRQW